MVDRDQEDDETVWKTHPAYFNKDSVREVFDMLYKAVGQADELDAEYDQYTKWQADLEEMKEIRKNGYGDWDDQHKTPEERTQEKLEKQREQQREKARMDSYQESNEINSPFSDLSLASIKVRYTKTANGKSTVKMSKDQWQKIGKIAGWG